MNSPHGYDLAGVVSIGCFCCDFIEAEVMVGGFAVEVAVYGVEHLGVGEVVLVLLHRFVEFVDVVFVFGEGLGEFFHAHEDAAEFYVPPVVVALEAVSVDVDHLDSSVVGKDGEEVEFLGFGEFRERYHVSLGLAVCGDVVSESCGPCRAAAVGERLYLGVGIAFVPILDVVGVLLVVAVVDAESEFLGQFLVLFHFVNVYGFFVYLHILTVLPAFVAISMVLYLRSSFRTVFHQRLSVLMSVESRRPLSCP